MITKSRNLVLDVFNNTQKLCTLYDNTSDASGQAHDVFVTTERNGWRELSFSLPSTMTTENGIEPNFRLDFIKAEYKIRLIDDDGTDWYIITEPSYTHKGNVKDVKVEAGHICQLLKTKNLGLTFSDDEGNNVGTAEELLITILEGTGWKPGEVSEFLDKDGSVKKRSLKASAKTGAFKLISNMCDLFEAKPVYHGDTKTVDILPLNPFTISDDTGLPDVTKADGVMELAYSKNLSNVTRNMNSENLVTKLYAYGSFGDNVSGYCGIDECKHKEHVFVTSAALAANTTYWFSVLDDSGTTLKRKFTPDRTIPAGSKVIYSMLDPASMSYVWVESSAGNTFPEVETTIWADLIEDNPTVWETISEDTNTDAYAYLVEQGESQTTLPYESYTEELVKNWFSYLMDLTYFEEIGMMTEEARQKLAGFQRFAHTCYEIIYQKTWDYNESYNELSRIIGDPTLTVKFCRLDVALIDGTDGNEGYMRVHLNKETYDDGVIYRSDYDEPAKKHFQWTVTSELQSNGDPKNAAASMLVIIHAPVNPGDLITWDKAYLKAKDTDEDPTVLTFHLTDDDFASHYWNEYRQAHDKYYLFKSNNINADLGSLEAQDEANRQKINEKTKIVTVEHPLSYGSEVPVYTTNGTTLDIDVEVPTWYKLEDYAWFWKYDDINLTPSELYFCYYDYWGEGTEREYQRVFYDKTKPSSSTVDAYKQANPLRIHPYFYDWDNSKLYRWMNKTDPTSEQDNQWVELDLFPEQNTGTTFSTVWQAGKHRDQCYQGLAEYYTYTVPAGGLPAGNYVIEGFIGDNPFDYRFVFTTTKDLSEGDRVRYNTKTGNIEQIINGTLEPICTGETLLMEAGTISKTGELIEDMTKCRSANYIPVTAGASYTLQGWSAVFPLTVYLYSSEAENNETVHTLENVLENVSGYDGYFTVDTGITHMKLGCDTSYQIFNQRINDTDATFTILNGIVDVVEAKVYGMDSVKYHPKNCNNGIFEPGGIQRDDLPNANPPVYSGDPIDTAAYKKHSTRIKSLFQIIPGTTYVIKPGIPHLNEVGHSYEDNTEEYYDFSFRLHFYDYNKNHISRTDDLVSGAGGTFTAPKNAYYMKFTFNNGTLNDTDRGWIWCNPAKTNNFGHNSWYEFWVNGGSKLSEKLTVQCANYYSSVIIDDQSYTILDHSLVTTDGDAAGINALMLKSSNLADETYLVRLQELQEAQNMLKAFELNLSETLDIMYREGYWQKNDYVDGDEEKLYEDAIDSLKKISRPKATYNITYLDLYSSDTDETYGASEITTKTQWPDLSITSAIHLLDPDIAVNCWAYIDKLEKCYDQPWKTKISVNTELTTIAQHSFTDVMSNIADVASAVKGKEAVIDHAGTITQEGNVQGENLTGTIDTSQLTITGGSTTWHTDEDGNMVFESADGTSAMTLTGEGFKIANARDQWGNWNWRTFGDGNGFTADLITAGKLKAGVIVSELETSFIKIADDRIEINSGGELNFKGGSINMAAESDITIRSGGKFVVESGGAFTVDAPNFVVSEDGEISIEKATISDAIVNGDLMNNGYTVLTENDIVVDGDNPGGKVGRVWIKPNLTTSQTINTILNASVSGQFGNKTLTGPAATATNATSYKYTLTIPYKVTINSSSLVTRKLTATCGGVQFASGKALSTVYGNHTITLTATSDDTWLGGSSSRTVNLSLAATNISDPYNGYELRSTMNLSCTAYVSGSSRGWVDGIIKVYV